ncbi:MAG TPA: hypothetical protein PLW93_04435, partial [Candidatus Absconditabacterales bacterium]|nr:hypothetical protein [Candidatus Absconditabacterales bacterium]
RTLIKQYQQDCNMGGVFPGFQSADGIHLGAGDALYVWLPVSVGGFPVFLGSSSDKSNLDHGSASDAHPVLLPTPRGKLAHETKVKPQEFVTFENAWMDKVKNLPNQASFGQMNLAGTTIPVFHKTLNNFAGVNKTDDEVKKDYETAIKTELKHRIDLWMKQYVSYLPNYKGTQSHGIMIRNSSINTKLNNGKPIVIYVLNNKDYIESKIKNLGGLNSSSASLYNDFITGDQKVAFYRRNFTDKDNKTLDITQPSTWLDSHMYGAANRTDHNLLKPIIQDISQDGCFQGFPDRDDRVSIISKDCGIPYTQYILGSNDKSVFGLIMIQYFINELYWFWSKQTKGSNSSSYVYLNDVGRWLSQSGNVYCALCAMDYLAHP